MRLYVFSKTLELMSMPQINGQRIKAGKSSIGFLNAILYAHPEVLNDIVNGTNPGCGTDGFPAAKG